MSGYQTFFFSPSLYSNVCILHLFTRKITKLWSSFDSLDKGCLRVAEAPADGPRHLTGHGRSSWMGKEGFFPGRPRPRCWGRLLRLGSPRRPLCSRSSTSGRWRTPEQHLAPHKHCPGATRRFTPICSPPAPLPASPRPLTSLPGGGPQRRGVSAVACDGGGGAPAAAPGGLCRS